MRNIFNIKSYINFLSRNRMYSFINVFGFSVSLMFVVLIGVYTYQEYTVDSMHSKADRIYSIGLITSGESGAKRYTDGYNWRMGKVIERQFPEVEMVCCVISMPQNFLKQTGEYGNALCLFVDSTFYRMFDFPLVRGDRGHALDDINSAVVSEEFARTMFGDTDPVGKTFMYMDKVKLRVTGISGDMGNTAIPKADVVMRYENTVYWNDYLCAEHMGNAMGATLFVLAKPDTDLKRKAEQIDETARAAGFWIYNLSGDNKTSTMILNLGERYFSNTESQLNSNINDVRGDPELVGMLFTVGLVILLFSVFNYVNLTVAQSSYRAREMATRRLFGSQRGDVALRLMAESMMMCLISTAVGLLLAYISAPAAARLINDHYSLSLGCLLHPGALLLTASFVVAVGGLSGIIPAVVISRAKPIDVVRGTFRLRTKMVLSRVFIVAQNVIAIVMIAAAITMSAQVRHLVNAPLGYDYGHLLYITPPPSFSASQSRAFVEESGKMPMVETVSACRGTPLSTGNILVSNYPGKTITFWDMEGDENYMKALGLKVERDYGLADENKNYVNRMALSETGLKDDSPFIYSPHYRNGQVDGVYEEPVRGLLADIHTGTITDSQMPLKLRIRKSIDNPWGYLIKVKGDEDGALREVSRVYREIFKTEYAGSAPCFGQLVEARFAVESRLSSIVTIFTCIAILISLLGLVAMCTFFIQQRRKEIAVRKVFGSTNAQIYRRLVMTFMAYVCVAFVISIPIIYRFMGEWLSGFSYRISLSPLIFIAAGGTCLVVSFVAVSAQCRMAANENPAEHIKDNY